MKENEIAFVAEFGLACMDWSVNHDTRQLAAQIIDILESIDFFADSLVCLSFMSMLLLGYP